MARVNESKYIISLVPQRIHMSLYFTVVTMDAIVVFGTNRMRNTTLSYSDYCKIASKCASLWSFNQKRKTLRKVNGNIDNTKYQSDIIHDIEMTLRCVPTEGLYLYA